MGIVDYQYTGKGDWNSNTVYEEGDIIKDGDVAYICIKKNTDIEPPDLSYWQRFASSPPVQGETGPPGPAGKDGKDSTVPGPTVWTLLRCAAAIPSRLRTRSSGISMVRFAICACSNIIVTHPGRRSQADLRGPISVTISREDSMRIMSYCGPRPIRAQAQLRTLRLGTPT